MSTSNDMDALDSLLAETLEVEDTSTSKTDEKQTTETTLDNPPSPSDKGQDKDIAFVWTELIESAASNMQDSTRMTQQVAQKNIELAKQQSQSIKELSEASNGWRASARQIYEDVLKAKKNILTMSSLVIVFVVIGTSVTTGIVWQQGNNAQKNNQQLQVAVEEYYHDISKTLNTKLDEMVGMVEQIPTTPLENHKTARVAIEDNDDAKDNEEETEENTDHRSATPNTAQQESIQGLENQLTQVLQLITQQQAQQEQILLQLEALKHITPTATSPVPVAVAPTPTSPAVAAMNGNADAVLQKTTQTQQSLQQLQDTVASLGKQITQLDQRMIETQEQLKKPSSANQVPQGIPSQLNDKLEGIEQAIKGLQQDIQQWQSHTKTATETDKKLADQLTKLQNELVEIKQMQQTLKNSKAPANATQDRELAEQIGRLQRDIREIKQQQTGIKYQVQDVKQNLPTTAPATQPYQYRLDVEQYPR